MRYPKACSANSGKFNCPVTLGWLLSTITIHDDDDDEDDAAAAAD